jgi:hypothetical protein
VPQSTEDFIKGRRQFLISLISSNHIRSLPLMRPGKPTAF